MNMFTFKRRLDKAKYEIRYYGGKRRYKAMLWALYYTQVLGHISELCGECGRRYEGGLGRQREFFIWHSPQPLWQEINGRYGGLRCPQCFNRAVRAAGYGVAWTPVVTRRDGVATTNHWNNETRDWLLMGIPDEEYPDRSEPKVWAVVRDALEEAGYEQPPIDYYPAENFKLPSRSIPSAGV